VTDNDPDLTVPDDLSGLDGDDTALWHMHERLVLRGGEEFTRPGAAFPYEPHQGDVMGSSGHRARSILAAAKADGVLRWLPDDDGVMFVPLDQVVAIYVDLYSPDGTPIPAGDLKPGYHGQSATEH
jgi:hypothetical protein